MGEVAIFLAVADAFLVEDLRLSEKPPAGNSLEEMPDEVAAGASTSLYREPAAGARWRDPAVSRNQKDQADRR